MSKTLNELKQEAQVAAEYHRDHELGKWVDSESHPELPCNCDLTSLATCEKCGMYVQVMENPMPNEINVGGPAVAMDCPGVTACPECGEALCLDNAYLTPTSNKKHLQWEARDAEFFIIGTCKHCKQTIEVGVNIADRPIVVPF